MSQIELSMRPASAVAEAQSALIRSVFNWMAGGLVTTGLVAMWVLNTPSLARVLFNPGAMLVLILAELGLVFYLSARAMKMSANAATWSFLVYSALNGVTLAPIFLMYTGASVSTTFFITAATFGSVAAYGYVTKRDLSGMGTFLMMGLWGIIIAALINIFVQSSMVDFVVSAIGVIVFTGLTAWDTQMLRNLGGQVSEQSEDFRRYAILGALRLYLDFVNLFLMLLRFLGDRR